jgi:hypothetical protein
VHKCPCWSRGCGGPFSVVADEGVGEDEELAHDGDGGDLGGFSGFDEGVVFGFELRIEPDGAEDVASAQVEIAGTSESGH